MSTQACATTITIQHDSGVPASPSRGSRSAVALSAPMAGASGSRPSHPPFRCDRSRTPGRHFFVLTGWKLRAVLVAVVLLAGASGVWGVTITWNGSSGTDWTNTGNWTGGVLPGLSDDIDIPTGLTNYPDSNVSGSYQSLTIASGASVTLAGNMTITNAVVVNGIITVGSHAFSSASISGTGSVTVSTGSVTTTGDLTVTTLTFTEAGSATVGGNFTPTSFTANTSTVTLNNTGNVTGLTFSTLNVMAGTRTVTSSPLTAGTLTVSGGTLAVGGTNFQAVSAAVGAAVTVGAGGLFSTTGALTVNGGGSVTASGTGTVTVGNGLTVNGTGTISMGTGTLTVSTGGMALNGSGSVTSGGTGANAITVTGNLVWTNSSSAVNITGSGALNVTGTLSMDTSSTGSVSVAGGGMQVGGSLTETAATNGNITVTGAVGIMGQLTNYSLLQVTSGNLTVSGAGANSNSGTITTVTSGTQSYTGAMTNSGTISGFDLVTFGGNVTGAGTINSGTGGVTFAGSYTGGTLNGSTAGVLTFQGNTVLGTLTPNSSTVTFSGTVTPQTFDSNGQALPPVTINKGVGNVLRLVTSNVTQTAGSSLTMTAGTLDLATNTRSWTLQTGLTVGTNTILDVGAGSLLGGQAVTVSGSGVMTHTSGTLNVSSLTYSSSAASTLGTGTVTVSGSLTVNGSGSLTQTGLSALDSVGSISVSAGTMSWDSALNGGTLVLAGSMAVSGTGTLSLGNKTVTGVTNIAETGGTVNFQGSNVTTGGLSVTAGAVNFGSSVITDSGDAVVSTGGVVTAGTGLIHMTGAGTNLNVGTSGPICDVSVENNVTVTGAGSATDVGALTVTGAGSLAVGGNNFQSTSATISGPVTVGSGLAGVFSTSGAMTIATTGSVAAVAGTSGAVTVGNALTVNGTGSVSVVNGGLMVNAGGLTVTAAGGSVSSTGSGAISITGSTSNAGTINSGTGGVTFAGSYTGGTLNGSTAGVLTFQGSTVLGTFTPNSSTVTFSGTVTPQTFDSNGQTLPSVTINKGAGNILRLVTNNVTQAGGSSLTMTAGTLDLATDTRSWTLQTGLTVGTNTILDVGAGSLLGGQALTVSGSGVLTHTSGTLNVSSLTYSSSAASTLGTGTVTVSGALTVNGSGSLTQTGAGAAQSAGSISVTGGTLSWDAGNLTLAGLITASAGTFDLGDKVITGVTDFGVTGSSSITFSSGTTAVGGDLIVNTSGTVNAGTGIITMGGTGNLGISTGPIGPLTIAAAVTVSASGAGQDVGALVVSSGSLDVGIFNFQATSATVSAPVTVGAGGLFSTTGTLTVNGSGSVTASGTGTVTVGNGLTVNGTGSVSAEDGALTVNAGGLMLNGSGLLGSTGTGNVTVSAGGVSWGAGASSGITLSGTGALGIMGDFTQTATDNGPVSVGSGGMSVAGTLVNYDTIQLSGSALAVTGAGPHTNAGTITTLVSGTQNYTGAMANSGTISGFDLVTFGGDVTGAGTINSGTGGVTFAGSYTGGTLNGSTAGVLTFQGNTVLGTFTPNLSTVTFSGTVTPQTFNSNGQTLPSVTINKGVGNVLRLVTSNVTQAVGASLTMTAGTLDLATNNPYWVAGIVAPPPAHTFHGAVGNLILGSGSELICGDLVIDSGYEITNAGANTITASGNVTIDGNFNNPSSSTTLVMTGTAAILTATPQIGNLTVSGSVTLGAALDLKGNLLINSGGSLDVDSTGNYPLSFAGDWTNNADNTGFKAEAGTVTVMATSVANISGTTTWYDFVCTTGGVTIKFQNDPDVYTFLNLFRIHPPSGTVILTRLTDNGIPADPYSFPADSNKFWNISVLPSATIDLANVDIYFSNASAHPIIIATDPTVHIGYGSPYYDYRWLTGLTLVYSYTEDSDHNGKIDRIRVQAASAINGNFTGFTVAVSGYTVTGYDRPSPAVDPSGANFYILLRELGVNDTNTTPPWYIVSNTTLLDQSTGTKLAQIYTDPNPMVPLDTAAPKVTYTLASPSKDSIFVHLSEPIAVSNSPYFTSPYSITSTTPITTPVAGGVSEYLLGVTTAMDLNDIVSGATNIVLVNGEDFSGSSIPTCDPSDPQYPFNLNTSLPKASFPVSPGVYSSYVTAVSAPVPNIAIDTSHRISDVLISVPPANAGDNRYFVWPLWARDSVITEIAEGQYETLTNAEVASQTIGLVRDFTGTQWLRDQDITLQVRVNPALAPTVLSLRFDSSVADQFHASSANGPVGLWLPVFNNGSPLGAAFSGIVPWPNDGAHGGGTSLYTGMPQGSALWNFSIPASDPRVRSVSTLDFFLTLDDGTNTDDPLYVARLDVAPGAAIPADWYRRLKPFSFDIHDVTKQRSNATILNNVIDPTKGERVRLSYQLTKPGQVTIQVFTLDGDLVQVLYRGYRQAGDYTASWDGKNRGGRVVSRGMYFIRIVGPNIDEIRKVMVVKQ